KGTGRFPLPPRIGEFTHSRARHEPGDGVTGPPKTAGQFDARGKLSKEAGKNCSSASAAEKDGSCQGTAQSSGQNEASAGKADSFKHEIQSGTQGGTARQIKQVK